MATAAGEPLALRTVGRYEVTETLPSRILTVTPRCSDNFVATRQERGQIMENDQDHTVTVVRFCGQCTCGCPELAVDPDAPDSRRIVIRDDFGHSIHMSPDQLLDIVRQARSGALVQAVAASMPGDWPLGENS
jgi:hypothetical protein